MDLDLFGEELSSDEEVNQQPKHTEENSNNNVDDVDLFGEDLSDDEEDTGASKGKEQENSNSNGSADKEGDKVLDDQLNQLFDDFEQGDSSTFVESELVGAEGAAVNVPVPAIKDLESSKVGVCMYMSVYSYYTRPGV